MLFRCSGWGVWGRCFSVVISFSAKIIFVPVSTSNHTSRWRLRHSLFIMNQLLPFIIINDGWTRIEGRREERMMGGQSWRFISSWVIYTLSEHYQHFKIFSWERKYKKWRAIIWKGIKLNWWMSAESIISIFFTKEVRNSRHFFLLWNSFCWRNDV